MLGRGLLALSALTQTAGSFLADFNETHVKNPNWPPHAKFHNGQTMSLGLLLGSLTIYYAFRKPATAAQKRESLFTAAACGSIYWIAGLSAILYPGTMWTDPEFGTADPQKWLFPLMIVSAWGGWYLETKDLPRSS